MRIQIYLPLDRNFAGRLLVLGEPEVLYGPVPAAGKSHSMAARVHGNPNRDPLSAYGDTPYGIFAVSLSNDGTSIVLGPLDGQAALADAQGRFLMAIIGDADERQGRLRATAGEIRVFNSDLLNLVRIVGVADSIVQCNIAFGDALTIPVYEEGDGAELCDPPRHSKLVETTPAAITRRAALARTALFTILSTSPLLAPKLATAQAVASTTYTSGTEDEQPDVDPGPDTTVSQPSGPPAYEVKPGVQVDPGVSGTLFGIADDYSGANNGGMVIVTSSQRTATQQADAMFNNYQNNSTTTYRDTTLEQQIHDAYTNGVDAGETRDQVVHDMATIIQDAADRGEFISAHLTGQAIDVRLTDSNGNPIDFNKLQAAANAHGYRVIKEGNHYHLQPNH